jgi:prepilin-type N-terminal cleavage/methylation domain-containing protein
MQLLKQNPRGLRLKGCLPTRARVASQGFTLVELLVAMSIILILAIITIRLVGSTLDNDRLKGGSRELQSYLSGARDRAIYAGQPRGVRFIPDTTDPYSIRSFVYVGAPTNFTDGQQIWVTPSQTTLGPSAATISVIYGLLNRGLLPGGSQIVLGTTGTTTASLATGGLFYSLAPTLVSTAAPWISGQTVALGQTVQPTTPNGHTYVCTFAPAGATAGTTQPTWPTTQGGQVADNTVTWTEFSLALTKPYPAGAGGLTQVPYTLQLAPAQLPSEQPRSLPQNVYIDLRTSILPATWQFPPSPTSTYDLMFSPAGTVTGPVAASGRIHFVLSDITSTTGEAIINNLSNRLQLNAPWLANTGYVLGNVIVPTPSSYIAFRCTVAGTTGGTAPVWPTEANQSVTDGGVTWQSFVKRADLIVSVATSTGRVTTHHVDVADPLPTAIGYDSFRYAEVGEVTQ